MDPTRARALVRLERAAVMSEPFARAYRTGALSWVKAGILVPLVSCDPLGRFMEDWVAWAERVTVRRLRDDVEWALALEQTDPVAFRRSGGLPPDREIGAAPRDAGGEAGGDPLPPPLEREIGAPPRESAEETCSVRFFGPADIVQLFRAVLCTVRRVMERDTGRLPTAGQALGAMLDHALRIPPPAGRARGAAALSGTGARRAHLADGDPDRRPTAGHVPLGRSPGPAARNALYSAQRVAPVRDGGLRDLPPQGDRVRQVA